MSSQAQLRSNILDGLVFGNSSNSTAIALISLILFFSSSSSSMTFSLACSFVIFSFANKAIKCSCVSVFASSSFSTIYSLLSLSFRVPTKSTLSTLSTKLFTFSFTFFKYFFAALFTLGGAYALKTGSMVRVDVLIDKLAPRTQAIIDAITDLLAMFFIALLFVKSFSLTVDSIRIVERSFTPWAPLIFPLKMSVAIGAILMELQLISKFLRNAKFAISGEPWK